MPGLYNFREGDLVWLPDFVPGEGSPFKLVPAMVSRISFGNYQVTYARHTPGGLVPATQWARVEHLLPRGDYFAGVDL